MRRTMKNFETDEITDKADILIDEPWYMMLGRTLWEKIVRGEDDDLTIISELFKMDDISFNKLLTNIIIYKKHIKATATEID